MLESTIKTIENLKIITFLMPHSQEYKVGQGEIYGNVFFLPTKPDFMFTKLIAEFPQGNLEDSYNFSVDNDECEVNIFSFDDNVKTVVPFDSAGISFTEEELQLLDDAKRIMSEHKPAREEFVDPQRMREVFFNIGKDLIIDLAQYQNLRLKDEKLYQLSQTPSYGRFRVDRTASCQTLKYRTLISILLMEHCRYLLFIRIMVIVTPIFILRF